MIRAAVLSVALLATGCKTCPDPAFPRLGDIEAITAPRPKIPPAALDPNNPTAAANYQSADRAWGNSVSDAGRRLCHFFHDMGMQGLTCPPAD